MKLRYIETVDFRKSEQTNFEMIQKKHQLDLSKNDCILLVNQGENQLVFVYGFQAIEPNGHGPRQVLHSERFRLSGGTWNPLMLANYAARVGIELEGIRRFEEHYKRLHVKEVKRGRKASIKEKRATA